MAEAGYPGGKGFPTFSIMTNHDDPYVQAVVDTLRQNLGIKAVQDIEDPGVESAKRHQVQPANFVGYFSTGYTGILTWQNWVSNLYPPSQTKLLSLKPDDYTHYQVLQAEGTASSLSAAEQVPRCTREPAVPAVRRRGGHGRRNGESRTKPPRSTSKRRRSGRVPTSSFRTRTAPWSMRFARHQGRPPVDRVLHDLVQGRQRQLSPPRARAGGSLPTARRSASALTSITATRPRTPTAKGAEVYLPRHRPSRPPATSGQPLPACRHCSGFWRRTRRHATRRRLRHEQHELLRLRRPARETTARRWHRSIRRLSGRSPEALGEHAPQRGHR